MSLTHNARRPRSRQTQEEKQLWRALHRRTGCRSVERKKENRRFLPPPPEHSPSPRPSPHSFLAGRGRRSVRQPDSRRQHFSPTTIEIPHLGLTFMPPGPISVNFGWFGVVGSRHLPILKG